MRRETKHPKITKYRKYSFLNVGTLLFCTVFVYIVVFVFMYLTETHVTSYEVVEGTLSGNYRYDALAVRTETIVNAPRSGSVRYYAREGSKASAGSTVCSIDESGSAQEVSYDNFTLDQEDEQRLQDIISSFTINFSDENFQKAYDLKSSVDGALSEIAESLSDDYVSVLDQCNAPESGFVLYSIDGLESLTEEDLHTGLFDLNSYESQNLRSKKQTETGDPIYKLVTMEEWSLYFPLDQTLATELSDTSTLRFRFLKDNQTFSAPFDIIESEGEYFGHISMDSSLIRYSTDRYLEIELVLNRRSGLKIPTSAIVERGVLSDSGGIRHRQRRDGFRDHSPRRAFRFGRFLQYRIPGSQCLPVFRRRLSGKQKSPFRRRQRPYGGGPTKLSDPGRGHRHPARRLQHQQRVRDFPEVTVIDQNEEYCIVESNNPYGLAAHDYIVLNASEVNADDIVY